MIQSPIGCMGMPFPYIYYKHQLNVGKIYNRPMDGMGSDPFYPQTLEVTNNHLPFAFGVSHLQLHHRRIAGGFFSHYITQNIHGSGIFTYFTSIYHPKTPFMSVNIPYGWYGKGLDGLRTIHFSTAILLLVLGSVYTKNGPETKVLSASSHSLSCFGPM